MNGRRRLVVGNWKMNRGAADGAALAQGLRAALTAVPSGVDVLVCPPFTALAAVRAALDGSAVRIGAQDCHWEDAGAFTGQVAAPMLVAAGCSHVIVGHSECRAFAGDDDARVAAKVAAALRSGLTPILCVGEGSGEDRVAVVQRQVRAAFRPGCIVAYEPLWAIGSGRAATPEDAGQVARLIRGLAAAEVAVLYGGSVGPRNCAAFWNDGDCDGALVGGASLEVDSFAAIVAAAAR